MPEQKKGLSWFRLILLQVIIGGILIGICAYVFRIPVDEVRIVPPRQEDSDMFAGVPMRVDVTYPGLGTVSLEDPKELLKLKRTFSGLLSVGKQDGKSKAPRLLLSGSMAYLDQEELPFQVETNAFRFGSVTVNSLNVTAEIRKLQSTLIDKMLTADTVSSAIGNASNEVFRLDNGELTPLSEAERAALTAQVRASARVIDFSRLDPPAERPDAHFVVQLADGGQSRKHWLHLDRYNNAYIIVFDLLDETYQKAYFKLNNNM